MREVDNYTIKELRELCQATAPNPATETYVGRFSRLFSIHLTRLVLSFQIFDRVTPPMIVASGSLVFFLSAFAYLFPHPVTLLGPALYFLSIIIDGTDGEVARFRKRADTFGGRYAEPVSHDLQYGLFFFIISVALFVHGASPYILIAGALASITKLLYRLLTVRFWHTFYAGTEREKLTEQMRVRKERAPVVQFFYTSAKNIFSYPPTLIPLLIATVADRMDIFIYFYALGHALLFVALFAKQQLFIRRQRKTATPA